MTYARSKVVAREEHGKEEEDRWIGFDDNPEVMELGTPGSRSRSDDFSSISTHHLARVIHEEWDDDSDG